MNQLEQLKTMTMVVADSGDLDAIRDFAPHDATTNPSLILKAAQLPQYQPLIDDALNYAHQQGGDKTIRLSNACDRLAVNIGAEILQSIPGRISTEVDARLSFDRGLCVAKARKLIRLYQQLGINKSRVLIKLAATWEGIQAAEELEREGINCNLTLLFSFAQARACAEAHVYLISPFVGRIYDWYVKNHPQHTYTADTDPGVLSVRAIYQYYKSHRYPTIVMGASFRNTDQILALAGCDRLTITPALLQQLQHRSDPIICQLKKPKHANVMPALLSEAEFRWLHNKDAMAVDKLAEGIRLFAKDQEALEEKLISLI